MKLAFIGIGRLGAPIVRNLLRAGFEVTVYNKTRAKAELLIADGAKVAESAADAVRECDVVGTTLADDPALEQVTFGEQGIVAGLPAGAIHCSFGTISTGMARRLEEEHRRHGQHYVSSPVFGRPDAAAAKKLVVVPAGPEEIVNRCLPIFDAIGRQTFVVGREPWQANVVKLSGNFMIATMIEAFGEAFATLRKSNVAPQAFLDLMNSMFASPIYANYGRIIVEEQYDPAAFVLRLGLKDCRLLLEAAHEVSSPMPFASVIRDHFESAMAHGQGEIDWSALATVAARDAGLA